MLSRTLAEGSRRGLYTVHPPPTLREMKRIDVALSEPLFMSMQNRTMSVSVDQENVLRYMAGNLITPPDETIALYWKRCGFSLGDTSDVELHFRRDNDRNAAQGLLGAADIGGDRDSVGIGWRESDPRHAAVIVSASKAVSDRSVVVPGIKRISLHNTHDETFSCRARSRCRFLYHRLQWHHRK